MEIFEDFFGSENERADSKYIYPKAGVNANPHIKKAIQEGRVHWHEIAVDGNRAEIVEE